MKLILQYIRKHLGIFLLSTFFLTMEAMADLLQPAFMSYIVDEGVKNADVRRILFYGLIMLGIAGAGAFSAVMRNQFASRTSQTIGRELRRDMYHNVQRLSMENIDRLQPASIITRITNDVTQIQEFVNGIMRIDDDFQCTEYRGSRRSLRRTDSGGAGRGTGPAFAGESADT